jgi:hypothetical protein
MDAAAASSWLNKSKFRFFVRSVNAKLHRAPDISTLLCEFALPNNTLAGKITIDRNPRLREADRAR